MSMAEAVRQRPNLLPAFNPVVAAIGSAQEIKQAKLL